MKKQLKLFLALFVIFVLSSAFLPAMAAGLKNRIDATHLLAREIELPEITRGNDGISYADINPELLAQQKQLGDEDKFWIRNMATGQFEQITAILRSIGRNCYVYVEDSQSVSQSSIDRVKNQFDDNIYPTTTAHFGREARPGLDSDTRIYLLMADIQDGYKNPEDGYVAGYFFAGDQMRQSDFPSHSKVKSNEREILYLDTYPCDPDADDYLEIVAHEFQHMIHHNHDKDEITWVNEGCSQIAPVFCGFAPPGHYKLLKEDPDRSLNNWAKWNPMPDYGQVYLWNQYIVERLLPDRASRIKFFRTLVASRQKSIGGYIEAFKPFERRFSDIFTDFAITNRVNDLTLADGRFSYKTPELVNFRLPATRQVNTFPAKVSESVNIWGADAVMSDIGNVSSRLKISFSGYRRFMGPTHPFFRLAAIMQDSSGINPPEIKFFKLKTNPEDKNRQIGSIKLECNGRHDRLTVVVMALAPEEIDDTKYMPVSGFIYDLNYELLAPIDSRAVAPSEFDMGAFARAMQRAEGNLEEESIRIREQYANLLIRTIKSDLEKGSTVSIDSFIETANREPSLLPYSRDVAGLVNFYRNNQSSPVSESELDNRIEFLNQLSTSMRMR